MPIENVPVENQEPNKVWDNDIFEEEGNVQHKPIENVPVENVPVENQEPNKVWDNDIFEEEEGNVQYKPVEYVPKKVKAVPVFDKKIDTDMDNEVLSVQILVEQGLVKNSDKKLQLTDYDDTVIKQIARSKIEDIIPVMGESMAGSLKYFCDNVDLSHPDICDVVNTCFQKDSEFNNTLRELMNFTTLPTGKEMPRVLALLRESFNKSKSMKDVRLSICKPHARILKTQESRDKARKNKTVKEISIKEWLEKTHNWEEYPSGFSCFARYNNINQEEIKSNDLRAERMSNFGLMALSASFKKRNEVIASFIGEDYHGFVKLKMIDASIILAKVHSASYKSDYRTISYPRKFFNKSPFWLEADTHFPATRMDANLEIAKDETGKVFETKTVKVKAYMTPDNFEFKPRAYPIHEFKIERPKHIQEILAAVEAHPNMGGKAMFDQFWVIVPGIALASQSHEYAMAAGGKVWVIAKPDKTAELYQSAADAEKALDFRLTAEGCLRPVLLGEKDGKCYFLSYWN